MRGRWPFEAHNSWRRYLWDAGARERPDVYFPGTYGDAWSERGRILPGWRRRQMRRFQPGQHATQEWLAGTRFYRLGHWKLRELDSL